jgi:glycosyltransferase involved in cell wall biosynthesis
LDLSEESFLIGMTGRYHPTKDHANFLQAAALTIAKHHDVNFLMVGQGVDEQNAALRQLIESSGLTGRVHLLGERHDIARIAAALDVFSLSSNSESFPNVIGEAMACEVACAVTNVGDAHWIVGDSGLVVPPRDSNRLATAWSRIIELSAEDRMALGRSARERVIKYFQLDSVVRRYEELYSTIAAPKTIDDFAPKSRGLALTSLNATFDDSSVS